MPAEIVDIRHLKTLARLRRVNKQLSIWDELDAQAMLPPSLRPWVGVPVLDRKTLKELQAELVAAPGKREEEARFPPTRCGRPGE